MSIERNRYMLRPMEDDRNESKKGNGEIGIRHSLRDYICGASGRLCTNGRVRAKHVLSFEHVLADLFCGQRTGMTRAKPANEE